tara:strand:- start:23634 stop:24371 length:738 start_codon:yes stop_codon:yes gene_type:complete
MRISSPLFDGGPCASTNCFCKKPSKKKPWLKGVGLDVSMACAHLDVGLDMAAMGQDATYWFEKAFKKLETAYKQDPKKNYEPLVRAHFKLGDFCLKEKSFDLAQHAFGRALEVLKTVHSKYELVDALLAKAYNKRGNAFLAQGKVQTALVCFIESAAIRREQDQNQVRNSLKLAVVCWKVTRVYYDLADYENIIRYASKTYEAFCAVYNKDHRRPQAAQRMLNEAIARRNGRPFSITRTINQIIH